jgi:hypothetical protein
VPVRRRFDTVTMWGVFDGDDEMIAECWHEADARWFAENSPDAVIPTAPRQPKGDR